MEKGTGAPLRLGQTAFIALVAALELAVFVLDIHMPPGLTEWLLYMAPVVLCVFAPEPWLPVAAAAASTALLALGFYHSPSGPIDELAKTNRYIGAGVIWIVAVMGSRFITSRNRIQADRWLEEGQTRLSDAIRSERDRRELAARAVAEVCQRLGAQAGALFVAREDSAFVLAGGVAVPPRRMKKPPVFRPGEGLVGRAARQRGVLRVTDVPPGYADLTSGLGSAPARELLLSTVEAEGVVVGVLELGFSAPAPANAEAYLVAVAETVGAALKSAEYQANLRALLATSQEQASELQRQREDLRAVNEELEEQAHTLQRSQAKLEEQQTELEETNLQLKTQADALADQQRALEERNAELRRLHLALEGRAAELELAGRYKSEFLANMSHELRTPLNSALILARLLADNAQGNLSDEQVKYAETIHAAGVDLLALINDVLDLSKIEAGKMDVLPSAFSLDEVAGSIERAFGHVARDKGLRLSVVQDPHGIKMHTDRGRLDQIVRNLVSNALKFTERGEVEVRIALEGPDAVFRVRDTGVGIPRDQLERIFDAFHQAKGEHPHPGGTGLGLSIARRLAALMGGDIRVESTSGEGSVFTLRVPCIAPDARAARALAEEPAPPRAAVSAFGDDRAPAPREPAAVAPRFDDDRDALEPGRRVVLVVEDDERFAFVLQKLVNELGHQCLVALTGDEGLALARRHRPDAIVLDVKLPDQSGIAVLDQLKAAPATRHIPVHMLSILDFTQTAMEMGAVSYMQKPARREDIVAALSSLAARSQEAPKRVLVVEDDDAQHDAIRALIAQEDVGITPARTAAEALERLAEQTFDCMILDLGLPDTSGFELLEEMAAGARFAHPPVIVHTKRPLSGAEEERLQRYARSIVLKGARSPERLLHEVTLFLHTVEDRLPEEQQRLLAELRRRDRALERKSILLVDDDVRNVFALTRVLEEQRTRVLIARDGREALDVLEGDADVDLVLMDIMMPVMDGHEAIERIRAQPRFANLPIIALTARAMPDDHERCLRAGANDYLAKPVDVERLLALLRVWAGRRPTPLRRGDA